MNLKKALRIFSMILIISLFLSCEKKSILNGENNKIKNINRKNIDFKLSEKTGFYNDIEHKQRKSYVPILINSEYDKEIYPGQALSIRVTVRALKNFDDMTIKIKLDPKLIYANGDLQKNISSLNAGNNVDLEFVVEPSQVDKYKIIVHVSGKYNNRKMGSSRVITLTASGYDSAGLETLKKSEKPTGKNKYSTLPGKTDNQ